MMFDALTTILVVCAPLFALVAFGVVLRHKGLFPPEAHRFVTWLVYRFSLPILIFMGVCRQDFGSLLNWPIIVSTLTATALVIAAAWVSVRWLPHSLRGPAVATAYLANLSYIGFPLARNAFGDTGLTYAGIVNAFTMPSFVVVGVLLLTVGRRGSGSAGHQVRTAVLNPIVLAAFAGLLCSLVAHETAFGAVVESGRFSRAALRVVGAILSPIGTMGLPLSLIAVGGALRFQYVSDKRLLIGLVSAAKLIIAPLLTLLICARFFPDAAPEAVGTAVLLMGCPLSVGLYVISEQLGAESEFIASVLAVTTVGACVTVPAWVAVVM